MLRENKKTVLRSIRLSKALDESLQKVLIHICHVKVPVFVFLSSYQSLSDCEDNPAEGAALNQVTQSISRFGQREGLSHDRLDRAGFKQRDNSAPGVSPGRLRLIEHYEV